MRAWDEHLLRAGSIPSGDRPISGLSPPTLPLQEVETLKKELQEIKRQLDEQQSKKDSPKKKGTATPTQ